MSDTITIAQHAKIASVQVTLDISHTYRGDLRVTLLTPWGGAIVLHERNQGGSADDIRQTFDEAAIPALATLRDHSTQGNWRLLIQDLAPVDTGRLNHWALTFDASEQPQGPITLEEAPGTHIPDNDAAGITRRLSTDAPGNVASVEVFVNISHSWIGDLQIRLRSAAGTEVVLHDRTGRDANDIVQTYTVSNTPALTALASEAINGEWQLHIADRAEADIGKLNQWRIVIHPAV